MFVYTIDDIIGLIIFAVAMIAIIIVFLVTKISNWYYKFWTKRKDEKKDENEER